MTDTAMLTDPALYGLENRAKGSPCQTPCAIGCEVTCHERHSPFPAHDEFYCDQIRLGRDVSEYRPDIRLAFAALHAEARAKAMTPRERRRDRVRWHGDAPPGFAP